MREILFRGKRKDTGEWVEAFSILKCQIEGTWQFLVGASKNALMELDEHYNIHSAISEEDFLYYSVHPETMGQFVGFVDKNGKRVYEGDVIRFHKFRDEPDWTGAISYENGSYIVNGKMPLAYEKRIGKEAFYCPFEVALSGIDKGTIEVVGNIHDNPELQEATDGKETN